MIFGLENKFCFYALRFLLMLPTIIARIAPEAVKQVLYGSYTQSAAVRDFSKLQPFFNKERRIKIAGSGGQGVLSLGYILANMGICGISMYRICRCTDPKCAAEPPIVLW